MRYPLRHERMLCAAAQLVYSTGERESGVTTKKKIP